MAYYTCASCNKQFERAASKVRAAKSKNLLCSRKCQSMFLSVPVYDRLWPKIDKRGPDECWPWLGYRDKNGYGRVFNRHGSKLPTRLVVELVLCEPLPEWLFVLHHCDNPPCCNPAHLFLGNDAANTADKMAKGRHCRHDKRPLAKLTIEKAREIRAATGTLRELAIAFGVGQTVVWSVRHGRAWKEDSHTP